MSDKRNFDFIPDKKLISDEYYINKLSLALQNSYGISEHLKIFSKTLSNIYDWYVNSFWKEYDIFNYNDKVNDTEWSMSTEDDFLDQIASIYNISRNVTLYGLNEDKSGLSDQLVSITLNNKELYIYILASILKNNFDGTQECINEFTQRFPAYKELNIQYFFDENYHAYLYITSVIDSDREEHLLILFFNLKLTIKPLGLTVSLMNNYIPGGNLYDEAKYDLNYYE